MSLLARAVVIGCVLLAECRTGRGSLPASDALPPAPIAASPPSTCPRVATLERDGQRDFDFEIGAWKAHLARRRRPLTGSDEWVTYDGTSVVRKVWGGRANLGGARRCEPRRH